MTNEIAAFLFVVCAVFGFATSEYRFGWRLWLWVLAWATLGPILVVSFAVGVSLLKQLFS